MTTSHESVLLSVLWYLGIALDVAVLCLVAYRRAWREWPSVVTYCLIDLTADCILKYAGGNYPLRFITYWSWNFASSAVRLWIIFDVLRGLPGAKFLQKELRWVMWVGGAVLGMLAWGFSANPSSLTFRIQSSILIYDRAVILGWAAFVVAALAGTKFFGVLWERRGALVSIGMSVKIMGSLAFTYLHAAAPQHRFTANVLLSGAALLTLGAWVSAFAGKRTTIQISAHAEESFRSMAKQLTAH